MYDMPPGLTNSEANLPADERQLATCLHSGFDCLVANGVAKARELLLRILWEFSEHKHLPNCGGSFSDGDVS